MDGKGAKSYCRCGSRNCPPFWGCHLINLTTTSFFLMVAPKSQGIHAVTGARFVNHCRSYFQGYCEEKENIESMEALCNTIAGDAPLYSMFRKEGALVKCPFRGPFSFSYSKGDSGQECKYPLSFMDTCSDNKRLQLRYQACHDVQGSEIKRKIFTKSFLYFDTFFSRNILLILLLYI